ncbi:hypothetical protein [Salinimonas sediminis]|uniref:Uncharacterized protein n=1 Tax=Salinimonas sediminis TaxID=2303538 RepID=A0A346NMQ6_9ALTE|nr:hypothetical protein [Salinimonas sediminis]AXR06813.1 hypothetical protein D0Y50_10885 [Salinimonas sediminis]
MKIQIEYQFENEQRAYRFLNTATHFEAQALRVKLGRSNHHVKVSYEYVDGEFDTTASRMDDLARELEGEEVK